MPAPRQPARSGFTLLEVLAALALCVLLATVAATATTLSSAASRRAVRLQDQALRIRSLHAQARLRPETLSDLAVPSPGSPWRVDLDERFTPAPLPPKPPPRLADRLPDPPPPRRWILLALHAPATGHVPPLSPVQLAILETDTP